MKCLFAVLVIGGLLWPSAVQAAHWAGPQEHGACALYKDMGRALKGRVPTLREAGFWQELREIMPTAEFPDGGLEAVYRIELWSNRAKNYTTWLMTIDGQACELNLSRALLGGGWPGLSWTPVPWRP